MSRLDLIRDRAWRFLDRPGRFSETARRVNDALGRPLAPADELADRRAFEAGYSGAAAPTPAAEPDAGPTAGPAPVVVFTIDKVRGDTTRVVQMLTDAEVAFEVQSLEDDPAGQAAVRRDSKGHRLPVVFVAGDVLGGREALINLGRAGIRKRVLGD